MGILYVVATPIGNLEDISIRAVKILLSVPVIACEDTRHTGQLVKILERDNPERSVLTGMFRRYISVRDWNEKEVIPKVLTELEMGDVALVCDAGTPLLSDPGYKIVKAVREAGFRVSPIPGAFAGAAALSASGLPTNKFLFWGFLPKKWDLQPELTHVIYESPKKTEKTINAIKEKYPTAKIVIAKELTKIHEQFIHLTGAPSDTSKVSFNTKGEVTLLVYWI